MSKLILVCALLSLLSIVISTPALIRPQNLSKEFKGSALYGIQYANYGNYFITNSYDESDVNYFAVFKIDSQGVLTNVTRVDVDTSYQYYSFFTNGKWFGCGFNLGITMFKLDANDQAVEKRLFEKTGGLGPVWMLSDDTIVAYTQSPAAGFLVYKYVSASDDWMEIQFIPFVIPAGTPRAAVTDNTIVAIDTSAKIYRFSRVENGTFVAFQEGFKIDPKYFPDYSLFYNGNDTIVIASTYKDDASPYVGYYMFFTDTDTTWTATFFSQNAVGFVGDISLGSIAVTAIDRDNILIGSPLHGALERKRSILEEPNFGKVVWIQRNNSIDTSTPQSPWKHIADVDSKIGNYFGSAVMSIGKHVGITQCATGAGVHPSCQFWVVPKCIVQPIGVTCDTEEFDSCDIDFTTNHFTVADPLCENTVTVTDLLYNDYTFTALYTLQRSFVPSESCNATLMCPRPMVPQAVTAPVASVPKSATSGAASLVGWRAADLLIIIGAILVSVFYCL